MCYFPTSLFFLLTFPFPTLFFCPSLPHSFLFPNSFSILFLPISYFTLSWSLLHSYWFLLFIFNLYVELSEIITVFYPTYNREVCIVELDQPSTHGHYINMGWLICLIFHSNNSFLLRHFHLFFSYETYYSNLEQKSLSYQGVWFLRKPIMETYWGFPVWRS